MTNEQVEAVCDQVEDPKTAKGLVKREVAQIVSPGTVTDQALLDPAVSNYLVAVLPAFAKGKQSSIEKGETQFGVSWAETSTGRFYVTAVGQKQLIDLLARLGASEILVPDRFVLSVGHKENQRISFFLIFDHIIS